MEFYPIATGRVPVQSCFENLTNRRRDKFGILSYQEVETAGSEFCDPLCKKSDYVFMEEKYEGGSNRRRYHEMLKGEKIKKASRIEESSRGIKLPQTKIEIEGSVEVHVEEEMSKEDFCEKCEKDECSKEKENDLEKNGRTKEMKEEKRENSKEELNVASSVTAAACHFSDYKVKKEPLEAWILRAFTGSETDDDLILCARGFLFYSLADICFPISPGIWFMAALGGARQIGGALVLVQIWAWSRIPALWPQLIMDI
ncbi:hypothetical protein M9H77_02845 [Catharanthus roseus]|uniref:Uncharacterized protein n=1 Tax=Catharanthus roseus TaxID=4058 RepID=A0ACC0C9R2_CATRO|nr:hypothetical protein M9H77_02845 [Catharanthus roseus]